MPKLLRPHIPLEPRCRVVLAQLGEIWIDRVIDEWRPDFTVAPAYRRTLAKLLADRLVRLAALLQCEVKALHLDHRPALALRKKVLRRGVHVGYEPDANDPQFLLYMEKHAHHIKTQVKGDGAQFPDRVLIKRERRRMKKLQIAALPSGTLEVGTTVIWPDGRKSKIIHVVNKPKRAWPARPFPKGRKFNSRMHRP